MQFCHYYTILFPSVQYDKYSVCFIHIAIMGANPAGYLFNDFIFLLLTMNLSLDAAGIVIVFCLLSYFILTSPSTNRKIQKIHSSMNL